MLFLGAAGAGGMQMNNRDRWGDTYANNTTKKMIALYDYDPQVIVVFIMLHSSVRSQ